MYLRMYLAKISMTITGLANELGYSRTHMQGICIGRNRASPRLVSQIVELTNGEVTNQDLDEAWMEYQSKKAAESVLHQSMIDAMFVYKDVAADHPRFVKVASTSQDGRIGG